MAHQVITLARACHLDFEFFKCVATSTNPIEFGGFNTKLCRELWQRVKPARKAVHLPLIDMNPAHPDSMLTAMTEAQRLMKEFGQDITILTNNHQFYRLAVNVKWVNQERLWDFIDIPRLGGMHMFLSFLAVLGVLVAYSVFEDIMKWCFGGVAHMQSEKKFPQNFRALRIVIEELSCAHLEGCESHENMLRMLESIALRSITINSPLGSEPDKTCLHHDGLRTAGTRGRLATTPMGSIEQMMPYLFASAHFNYVRYGLYHLRTMQRLPPEVPQSFIREEHTIHHKPTLWNEIWSDIWIQTTFMRYGHGPNGNIGITMKPETQNDGHTVCGIHINQWQDL